MDSGEATNAATYSAAAYAFDVRITGATLRACRASGAAAQPGGQSTSARTWCSCGAPCAWRLQQWDARALRQHAFEQDAPDATAGTTDAAAAVAKIASRTAATKCRTDLCRLSVLYEAIIVAG